MSAAPEYERENKNTDCIGLSASMAAVTDPQIANQFSRTSSPLDSAICCPFMIDQCCQGHVTYAVSLTPVAVAELGRGCIVIDESLLN